MLSVGAVVPFTGANRRGSHAEHGNQENLELEKIVARIPTHVIPAKFYDLSWGLTNRGTRAGIQGCRGVKRTRFE